MATTDYALSRYIQQTLQIPVYALHTGPKPEFPCIVYNKRSGFGSVTMSGPSFKTEVFTFSVKAKTLSQARLYADQIFALLQSYNNEVFAVNGSETEDYDEADELYYIDQDYQCIVGATLPFYNVVRGDGLSGSLAIWNDKYVLTASNAINFTGSTVNIPGDVVIGGTITGNISASIESASYALTASYALNSIVLPSGLVSGSDQIDYSLINNKPTSIATASYVSFSNVDNVPSGIVSSSGQVDYLSIQNKPTSIDTASYVSFSNVDNMPSGLVSGSEQVASWTVATASYVSLDSDLIALANNISNGLWARTGTGTGTTRVITGTTDQVTVVNGGGVSGNPTLSLPQSIATTSTPQFAQVGIGLAADVTASLSVGGPVILGSSIYNNHVINGKVVVSPADGYGLSARGRHSAAMAMVSAQRNDYTASYSETLIKQYGTTATGTTSGISHANLGALCFINTAAGVIATNGASPLYLGTADTTRLTISATGNVGIGTATPSASFHVTGSTIHGISTTSTHTFTGSLLVTGSVSLVVSSSTGASTASLNNSPVSGNPTGWLTININGTDRKMPYW